MLRLPFVVVLVVSCSAPVEPLPVVDSGSQVQDAGVDAGESPDAGSAPALDWQPCPLHSELTVGVMAECATVQLPLRRERPDAGVIDVFVKRYAPDGGTRERQLWMLQGGPGNSGMGYENIAEQLGTKLPELEFYLPDHRGVGRSSRLSCPLQEAAFTPSGALIAPSEWPACLARVVDDQGGNLSAYSTTNAANDVGLLISLAHDPAQQVFLYGASYGTYWLHRYLQLFPHQADGVVLDSIVSVSARSLAEQDSDANEAGKAYFDTVCKNDATCTQKLGADPWATAEATFAKLKAGHCAAFATAFGAPAHLLLRRAFAQMLMGFALKPYIAAALYRADRCSLADEDALTKLLDGFYPSSMSAAQRKTYALWGWVLSNNVLFGEMWPDVSPTAADLLASREGSVVSRDVTSSMDALIGIWPAYPKDAYVGAWAQTDVPMLMLAGGLDPATILRKQRLTKPHFTGAHQTWVEFPLAGHGVIGTSPTNQGFSCGTAVMASFLRHPEAAVDTSCLSDLKGLSFAGDAATTMTLFGTTDPWN